MERALNLRNKRSLILTAIAAATFMTSCGGAGTPAPQAASAATSTTQPINWATPPLVILSRDGQQALNLLRTAGSTDYTENDYVNVVVTTPLPGEYRRRVQSRPQVLGMHEWVNDTISDLHAPIQARWVRAYQMQAGLTPAEVVANCEADQVGGDSCAASMQGASHASVERQAEADSWVLILASIDQPIRIQPGR